MFQAKIATSFTCYMLLSVDQATYICTSCLRRHAKVTEKLSHSQVFNARRHYRSSAPRQLPSSATAAQVKDDTQVASKSSGEGEKNEAMSRLLEQMTEEGIEGSGTRAGKVVEEAGFSEDLKKKLQARILDSKFRSENAAAFATVEMPSSAGQGTRDVAGAQPWTGTESVEGASLRMLEDAHKPLRGFGKPRLTKPVDLRPKNLKPVPGPTRLANARDKTSIYSLAKDSTTSDKEKEEMRKLLKDRFTQGARPMPATVQGLQSVASQRIEDAIARGQFKNIPRGKGVNIGRDHNADSAFIDTTEYFMNKIIKKQDLTPPWIEKQAEIHRNASGFRSRLRAAWKRHAARTIASKGASLEAQVQCAQEFAEAEAIENPPPVKKDVMSSIDSQGNLTYVQVEEQPISQSDPEGDTKIVVTEVDAEPETAETISTPSPQQPQPPTPSPKKPNRPPFRDPSWEALEAPYHTAALKALNDLTRSYNLMAPDLAKKPYFSLDRELKACFAEVAAQLPDEIRERARRPQVKIEVVGHRAGGVLEKFGAGETARVYDSTKPRYGFREFWRDLFAGDKGRPQT